MSTTTEADVLERLVPELAADGYEVYLNPRRELVPQFLGTYQPDLLARRNGEGLVIEVASRRTSKAAQLKDIRELFEQQPNWKFQVLWLEEAAGDQSLQTLDPHSIDAMFEEVRKLSASGHQNAAVLVGWGALEALGRAIYPNQLSKPQSPARLVRVLSENGAVTPDEADFLRSAIDVRNAAAHGAYQHQVSEEFVRELEVIAHNVAQELLPAASAPS